jgi:hypothetical protein
MLKIRKFFFFAGLMLMLFSLQGCFEIAEEITINEDTSGTLTLTAGVSEDNGIFGLLGSFTDISFLDDIENDVRYVVNNLKSQPGVSNVRFTKPGEGRYRLSFDFRDGESLNDALYAAAGQEKKFCSPSFYKIGSSKFRRKNITNWATMFLKREKENLPDESLFDLIEYKTVVSLPRPVRSVRAAGAVVSDDEKSVSTSNFVSDILNKRINTKVVIRY